jgi:hypothetical protein
MLLIFPDTFKLFIELVPVIVAPFKVDVPNTVKFLFNDVSIFTLKLVPLTYNIVFILLLYIYVISELANIRSSIINLLNDIGTYTFVISFAIYNVNVEVVIG